MKFQHARHPFFSPLQIEDQMLDRKWWTVLKVVLTWPHAFEKKFRMKFHAARQPFRSPLQINDQM
jgi:hypothetical protein